MPAADIALFAYRRPDHLARTLGTLRSNREAATSRLFVFSDGPKSDADREDVMAVRRLLSGPATHGFADVAIIERDQNWGLSRSIIDGVTQLVHASGRLIVLEDDMELSPYFLQYMNQALKLYADEPRVASIHGHCFDLTWEGEPPETFFLRGADCWGWATWSRAWELFEPDSNKLLETVRRSTHRAQFNFDGAYNYENMLEAQLAGRIDSWAIRWHASCFLADRLTLFPGMSLLNNIGVDGSGSHSDNSEILGSRLRTTPVEVGHIPVEPSAAGYRAYRDFYQRSARSRRPRSRFLRKGQKMLKQVAKLPGKLSRLGRKRKTFEFSGPYESWDAALAISGDYNDAAIFEKVATATRAVIEGSAAFERDSVVFEKPDAAYPATACLLRTALAQGGRLKVIDFGGALGSFYRQHRDWLECIEPLVWAVVEQPGFVELGRAGFSQPPIEFHDTIEQAEENGRADVILFSGVLQYLRDVETFVRQADASGARYLLIDRTAIHSGAEDAIFVQHVPPEIYTASYPIRVMARANFESLFEANWRVLAEFDAMDGRVGAPKIGSVAHHGWLLERKTAS